MNHKEFEPAKDLADFVMCYWTLESAKENTPQKNTIIPDGTMKMIFHYGDPYRHYEEDGNNILLPRCFVIGQLTRPYIVEPTGRTGTFFVRFQPTGFLPFTSMPIKEMENTAVPLEKLFGEEGIEIQDNILHAHDNLKRIKLIESFLLGQLSNVDRIDNIVRSTIETISTANGQLSINELSTQMNLNRRLLLRKFSSKVGLSPKQLSKIIRLQVSLKSLLSKKVNKLSDLAYENEFFDQAHFIKDFKQFTGLTPKEFYGDDLKMSLIFEEDKPFN